MALQTPSSDDAAPAPPDAPVFPCTVTSKNVKSGGDANDPWPLPDVLPTISWRAGLDLNPLSVGDTADTRWLEQLIWPEHHERRERFRQACARLRETPPTIEQGDLLADLPSLAARAPRDATLVIFHSAVLAYVGESTLRDAFAETVRGLDAVWISNEVAGVFPAFARDLERRRDRFLLCVNEEPVAWTGPHGQSLAWI